MSRALTSILFAALASAALAGCDRVAPTGAAASTDSGKQAAANDPRKEVISLRNHLLDEPADLASRARLIQLLASMGDEDGLRRELRRIDRAAERDAHIAPVLAEARLALGEADKVLTAIDAGASGLSSDAAAVLRGRALLALSRPDEALTQFEQVLATQPDRVEVQFGRARALAGMGREAEGVKALEKIAATHPEFGQAQLALGGLYARGQDFRRAEMAYRSAATFDSKGFTVPERISWRVGLVDALLAQSRVADARVALTDLAAVLPDAPVTLSLSAAVDAAEGKTEAAIAGLYKVVATAPEYAPARLTLARLLLARGSAAEARTQLDWLNARFPTNEAVVALTRTARDPRIDSANPVLLNNLAWQYYERGDGRAEETARQAYELAPGHPQIVDTYGWILLNRNELPKALPLLKEAALKAPGDPQIQYHFAAALVAGGYGAQARPILERLVADERNRTRQGQARDLLAKLAPAGRQ